jgi:hypothetical protein
MAARYAAGRSFLEEDAAMNVRILRHAPWPAFLVAAGMAACSNSARSPDAFVQSFVQAANRTSTECNYGSQQTWIDVGLATGNQPATVTDGQKQMGAGVSVSCRVSASGSGFAVQANVALSGQGSIAILGTVDATSGGTNVSGSFLSENLGDFSSQACTITYTYMGETVPASPPVAAGRIWGHLSCPASEDANILRTQADGGTGPETCDTEADFRFEFCDE